MRASILSLFVLTVACAACSSGRSNTSQRLAQSASPLTALLAGYEEQAIPRPVPDSADYGAGLAVFQGGALVSAIDFDDYRGRVVAFARSALGGWTPAGTLAPRVTDDAYCFGFTTVVSDDTAAIGGLPTPGMRERVWIFRRNASGQWQPTPDATLQPDAPINGDYLQFGASFALDGDTLLVGAPTEDAASSDEGSVYVFERQADGSSWLQTQKLHPSGPARKAARFGSTIALRGDRAVVTASGDGGLLRPALYVFERPATKPNRLFVERARLDAPDGYTNDFGFSAALLESTAFVGDPDDSNGVGAVFQVRKGASGDWRIDTRLKYVGIVGDRFGTALATSRSQLFVGAPGAVLDGFETGRVEAFDADGTPRGSLFDRTDRAGDSFGGSLAAAPFGVVVTSGGGVHAFVRALGASCAAGIECGSGQCADGVCCNSRCDGTCEACSAGLNRDGVNGTCGTVRAETDPHESCTTSVDSCGQTGLCAADGTCALQPAIVTCGVPACDSSKTALLNERSCDGRGTCNPATRTACAQGFLCRDGTCLESCMDSADCDQSQGFFCGDTSKCTLGAQCSADRARAFDASGAATSCGGFLCKDGSCPDRCQNTSDCQALFVCNPVDKTCQLVCTADNCDLSQGFYCGESGKCTSGAQCSADRTRAYNPSGVAKSCGNFLCKDGACPAQCVASEDCQEFFACDPVDRTCKQLCTAANCDRNQGFYCGESGKCTSGAQCSADRTRAYNASGVAKNCGTFLCKDGACPAHCEASEDCQKPLVCDPVNKTCQKRCSAADCDRTRGLYCGESGKCTSGAQCSADRTRAYNASGVAKSCGDLFCKDGSCPDHCEASADCQKSLLCNPVDHTCWKPCTAADCDRTQGFYCGELGKCTSGAQCSADRSRAYDASGVANSCGDTLCKDGVCAEHCSVSDDCRKPLVCDPFEKTCGPESTLSSRASGDSGCAIARRFVSTSGLNFGAFASLIGLLALLRRSRSRKAQSIRVGRVIDVS